MEFQALLRPHCSKYARLCFVIAVTFIFGLCVFANQLYLRKALEYDAAINLLTGTRADEIKQLPEARAMPAYPAKEGCRIIGGALIVKFAQPEPVS